jgi:hypothetical protein
MKIKETTEEVSSHPGEKGLQIRGEGIKSTKRPTPVVDKNPNGKSRVK